MLLYCCKCRQKTETVEEYATQSANNRFMIKGKCVDCKGKKQQFVKESDIEGLTFNKEQ